MKVEITGTVRVMQWCSALLDFEDEYCDMLPFYRISTVRIDGSISGRPPYVVRKAYREIMSDYDKPWVIRRGQLIDNYTRTYYVDGDDVSKLQIVVSNDFGWMLNAKVSEYILYDGQKVEADDQNEELIEGYYDEFLIKR